MSVLGSEQAPSARGVDALNRRVVFLTPSNLFFGAGSLTKPGTHRLTKLADPQASGSSCLCFPDPESETATLSFYMGTGDSNLEPHPCTASALTSEPFHQPWKGCFKTPSLGCASVSFLQRCRATGCIYVYALNCVQ